MICPRSYEVGRQDVPAEWRSDDTCSFCGSLNPDVLMARLEAGNVALGPTDKSYKVYVHNVGGEPFRRSHRDCPKGSTCTGPNDCAHWVTEEVTQAKFYFQHFSPEQGARFVELLNTKKLKLGYPGHFYALPFFIQKGDQQ